MQLHSELHAGKGADDTVYAASLGRKVSDGPRMAEVILMHQGAGERHGKSGMLSGDHSCALSDSYATMFTWVARNCSRRARSSLLHLKKFHPKLGFQGPPDCGGSNGDGKSLFRNPEAHCEEGAALYRKIAHDLAATHPEVVYNPYPGMVARECSRDIPLGSERPASVPSSRCPKKASVSKDASLMRLLLTLPSLRKG